MLELARRFMSASAVVDSSRLRSHATSYNPDGARFFLGVFFWFFLCMFVGLGYVFGFRVCFWV